LLDLAYALDAHGYNKLSAQAGMLPRASGSRTVVALQRTGHQDLIVMARQQGDRLVEGIAAYDHGNSRAKWIAWTCLARQIERAAATATAGGR
jgi:hypothetical protein